LIDAETAASLGTAVAFAELRVPGEVPTEAADPRKRSQRPAHSKGAAWS